MPPIENITDMGEAPTVGRFYWVPCVRVPGRGFWPVTGPRHEDAAIIKFPRPHWHYDLRFTSEAQMAFLCNRGRYARDLGALLFGKVGLPDGEAHGSVLVGRKLAPPVLRRRRCLRAQPSFVIDGEAPPWQAELEAAYSQQKVACQKCPHRGLPLASLPRIEGTNQVICPGHGLRWDLGTGKLVRTTQTPKRLHPVVELRLSLRNIIDALEDD